MKKYLRLCLAFCLMFSMTGCQNYQEKTTATTKMISGEFSGSAVGQNGEVSVTVTVEQSKITAIDIDKSAETSGIGDVAATKIISQVLEGQTLNVDNVSGCTVSSAAFKTAIADALSKSGLDMDVLKSTKFVQEKGKDEVKSADVVIVGSGAAGLTAAISAAKNHAKVIVLEKLPRLGGATITSSGMIVSAGTDLQKQAGIEDSEEALYQYWIERGEGQVDEEIVRFVADQAIENLEFLMSCGVPYTPEGITFSGTAKVARAHVPAKYGVDFINSLVETANKLDIEIITEANVNEVTVDEQGQITGVKADKNGATLTVDAKAVILATGGYGNDAKKLATYSPVATDNWSVSSVGNTGDGIDMATSLNAATEFKDAAIGWKVVSPLYGHTSAIGLPIYGSTNLFVDENGDRFVNEGLDYPYIHQAMAENQSKIFYFLFDSKAPDTTTLEAYASTIDSLEAAVEAGVAFKGETIEELQKVSGLKNLSTTMTSYNEFANNKKDTQFDKDPEKMISLETGPYYALQVKPAILGTFGGIVVNTDSEVLDSTGKTINGFYAAGEVANSGFFGHLYPASGSSIAQCVAFGIEAGKNAADYAQQK